MRLWGDEDGQSGGSEEHFYRVNVVPYWEPCPTATAPCPRATIAVPNPTRTAAQITDDDCIVTQVGNAPKFGFGNVITRPVQCLRAREWDPSHNGEPEDTAYSPVPSPWISRTGTTWLRSGLPPSLASHDLRNAYKQRQVPLQGKVNGRPGQQPWADHRLAGTSQRQCWPWDPRTWGYQFTTGRDNLARRIHYRQQVRLEYLRLDRSGTNLYAAQVSIYSDGLRPAGLRFLNDPGRQSPAKPYQLLTAPGTTALVSAAGQLQSWIPAHRLLVLADRHRLADRKPRRDRKLAGPLSHRGRHRFRGGLDVIGDKGPQR